MKQEKLSLACIAKNLSLFADHQGNEHKNFRKCLGRCLSHWDEKLGTRVIDKPTRILKKLHEITGVDFALETNYWKLYNLFTIMGEASRIAIEKDLRANFEVYEHTITKVRVFNNVRVVLTLNINISHGDIYTNTTLFAGDKKLL